MAIVFTPGAIIGRGDLNLFLTNCHGNPTNAFEITYAVYFVFPGLPVTENLVGDPARVPLNPVVGEYYASLMVPPGSSVGTYRIRWTFRENINSPLQQAVQEFAVVTSI